MNLFVTNKCPVISAQDHCLVHLRKMIVEVAQMLSTAHHELDGEHIGYKPTHNNHPCSIWIRSSDSNYTWAYRHLEALCKEYTMRTGKVHKTESLLDKASKLPNNIPSKPLSTFAMAMPDEFKKYGVFDQTVAYQKYLCEKFKEWLDRDKPIAVEWGNRQVPTWVNI